MIRFIGDVHGLMDYYAEIIDGCRESIQVGDFGIGFVEPYYKNDSHRHIKGNHDNPTECLQYSNYIPDGTIETLKGKKLMFVGGAKSIDKHMRVEGVSWWPDEELSYEQFLKIYDDYQTEKPDIMVTHECPNIVADQMLASMNKTKFNDMSVTRQAFDHMFQIHKPKLWIFGHWHMNFDRNILGTRFICLDELSYIDIDFDDLSKGTIKIY